MDKRCELESNDYEVEEFDDCVVIKLLLLYESIYLEAFDVSDYEYFLEEHEIRQCKAKALELAVKDGLKYREAYENLVGQLAQDKYEKSIKDNIKTWQDVPVLTKQVNGYKVSMYTLFEERGEYVYYYVAMKLPISLWNQLSADKIMELYDEMICEIALPNWEYLS